MPWSWRLHTLGSHAQEVDDEVRAGLEAGAALSSFCALQAEPGPEWVSWADLLAEPDLWRVRAAEVHDVLSAGAPVDQRIVASLVHLGLVARLLSPTVGAALAGDIVPVVGAAGVRLQLRGTNPLPMAWAGVTGGVARSTGEVGALLIRHWLEPLVQPWTELIAGEAGLSGRVLRGNVVSAIAGTLRLAATRPGLSHRAEAILDALLASGPLAGTGTRRADRSFLRHSCCLFYQLPGAGTCSDCVLTTVRRSPS